jgi:hypothetical protein
VAGLLSTGGWVAGARAACSLVPWTVARWPSAASRARQERSRLPTGDGRSWRGGGNESTSPATIARRQRWPLPVANVQAIGHSPLHVLLDW